MAGQDPTTRSPRERWTERDHSKKFSTVLELNAFKPAEAPYEVADETTRGLRVRIRPDGARFALVRLRMPDGKLRSQRLGRLDKQFGLADARLQAEEYKRARRQVGDPFALEREDTERELAERREVEAKTAGDTYTLRDMVNDFLGSGQGGKRRSEALRAKTQREYARSLTRDLGDLAGHPAASVTPEQVQQLYDSKALGGRNRKPAPVGARRLLAALSSAYGWAQRQTPRRITHNPCLGLALVAHKPKAARALTAAELVRLMKGWPHGVNPELAFALELILRLGQRPSNVYSMRWRDLDLEERVWRIPPEGFKTGIAHEVPLPPAVVAKLNALRRHPSGLVFARDTPEGWQPLRLDVARNVLLDMLQTAGIDSISPKELQKTCVTRAVDQCGVARDVMHLGVQGHALTGVQRHYFALDMQADVRAALEKWNGWLDGLMRDG